MGSAVVVFESFFTAKIKIISTDINDPILVLEEIPDPLKVRDLIWASVRAERTAHVRYISNA